MTSTKPAELGRLFAARGEDGQQRGCFDFRHLACEDLFKNLRCLLSRQSGSIFGEWAQKFFHQ